MENRVEIKETHQSPIATGLTQKLSIFYVSLVFAARIGVVGSLYTGVGGDGCLLLIDGDKITFRTVHMSWGPLAASIL